MSLDQHSINRIYKCTNEECEAEVSYVQKATDAWKKRCPFCRKNSLLMDRGFSNLSIMMDLNKPKTIGSLGEKNYELAKKEGKDIGEQKKQKPFWRNKKKIDYSILKNPKKYIETGTT